MMRTVFVTGIVKENFKNTKLTDELSTRDVNEGNYYLKRYVIGKINI